MTASPPHLARLMLRWLLRRADGEDIEGSLDELYRLRADRDGIRAARVWYWRQVGGFAVRLGRLRRHAHSSGEGDEADTERPTSCEPERRPRRLELWVHGVRHAVRALARQPGFALLAVMTLALGIGSTTAMFSVLNGVVLQPLRYADPGALVVVWPEMVTNMRAVEWLGENTRSFAGMSGMSSAEFAITGDGAAERVGGARVSTNHFDVLGVRSLVGRTFLTGESEPARSRVVVLSHGLWQTRYGGDPSVVGRTIRIDYTSHLVIGVMPAGFRAPDTEARLWIPQEVEPGSTVGTDETWWVRSRIARLAPGVPLEAAQRDLRAAAVRMAETYPSDVDRAVAGRATVMPLRTAVVGEYGRTLWILLGGVGLVLLIACSNVANLLLARAGARQRDVAVRTALGASRQQVIVHLLAESLVLGIAGGIAGILMTWATLAGLASFAPADLPRIDEVGIDTAVLSFALAVSLLTPLVFGLAPAWRTTRLAVRDVIAGGGRGAVGMSRQSRLTSGLIAAEVAIAVVLVIGAGLMLRSLSNLRAVDPGFDPRSVLTLHVTVPPAAGDRAEGTDMATFRELFDRLRAMPGIQAAGGIHILPLGSGNNRYPYWAEDNEPPAGTPAPAANIRVTTPGWIDVMRIRRREGRWFADSDRIEGTPVMVINRTLADRLWPGRSPIGRHIRLLEASSFEWEVIGVIDDVHQMALARDPNGEIYLPHEQWRWTSLFLTLRTAGAPGSLVPAVRRVIADVDDGITIARVATMEQVVAASLASSRFVTTLTGVFAGLALLLGAIGVYAVIAFGVSRRIPEFGVRLALGSSGIRIIGHAMTNGLVPIAIGVVCGLGMAWITTRVLSTLLFGVAPVDPATWSQVVGVVTIVGIVACYVPARRASRVDPATSLRRE